MLVPLYGGTHKTIKNNFELKFLFCPQLFFIVCVYPHVKVPAFFLIDIGKLTTETLSFVKMTTVTIVLKYTKNKDD